MRLFLLGVKSRLYKIEDRRGGSEDFLLMRSQLSMRCGNQIRI
jgi:hypothetical protein